MTVTEAGLLGLVQDVWTRRDSHVHGAALYASTTNPDHFRIDVGTDTRDGHMEPVHEDAPGKQPNEMRHVRASHKFLKKGRILVDEHVPAQHWSLHTKHLYIDASDMDLALVKSRLDKCLGLLVGMAFHRKENDLHAEVDRDEIPAGHYARGQLKLVNTSGKDLTFKPRGLVCRPEGEWTKAQWVFETDVTIANGGEVVAEAVARYRGAHGHLKVPTVSWKGFMPTPTPLTTYPKVPGLLVTLEKDIVGALGTGDPRSENWRRVFAAGEQPKGMPGESPLVPELSP